MVNIVSGRTVNPVQRKYFKGGRKVAKAKLGSGARFKKLSGSVAQDYMSKGKSPEEARRIGAAVAASVGRKKYGAKKMAALSARGRRRNMSGMSMHTEVNCNRSGRRQAISIGDILGSK